MPLILVLQDDAVLLAALHSTQGGDCSPSTYRARTSSAVSSSSLYDKLQETYWGYLPSLWSARFLLTLAGSRVRRDINLQFSKSRWQPQCPQTLFDTPPAPNRALNHADTSASAHGWLQRTPLPNKPRCIKLSWSHDQESVDIILSNASHTSSSDAEMGMRQCARLGARRIVPVVNNAIPGRSYQRKQRRWRPSC